VEDNAQADIKHQDPRGRPVTACVRVTMADVHEEPSDQETQTSGTTLSTSEEQVNQSVNPFIGIKLRRTPSKTGTRPKTRQRAEDEEALEVVEDRPSEASHSTSNTGAETQNLGVLEQEHALQQYLDGRKAGAAEAGYKRTDIRKKLIQALHDEADSRRPKTRSSGSSSGRNEAEEAAVRLGRERLNLAYEVQRVIDQIDRYLALGEATKIGAGRKKTQLRNAAEDFERAHKEYISAPLTVEALAAAMQTRNDTLDQVEQVLDHLSQIAGPDGAGRPHPEGDRRRGRKSVAATPSAENRRQASEERGAAGRTRSASDAQPQQTQWQGEQRSSLSDFAIISSGESREQSRPESREQVNPPRQAVQIQETERPVSNQRPELRREEPVRRQEPNGEQRATQRLIVRAGDPEWDPSDDDRRRRRFGRDRGHRQAGRSDEHNGGRSPRYSRRDPYERRRSRSGERRRSDRRRSGSSDSYYSRGRGSGRRSSRSHSRERRRRRTDSYDSDDDDVFHSGGSPPRRPGFDSRYGRGLKPPPITLKKFTGKYEEWPEWADAFREHVHHNPDFGGVQKWTLLRSHLEGGPLDAIRGFPNTCSSYAQAWKRLEERYQRSHVITRTVVEQISYTHPKGDNPSAALHCFDKQHALRTHLVEHAWPKEVRYRQYEQMFFIKGLGNYYREHYDNWLVRKGPRFYPSMERFFDWLERTIQDDIRHPPPRDFYQPPKEGKGSYRKPSTALFASKEDSQQQGDKKKKPKKPKDSTGAAAGAGAAKPKKDNKGPSGGQPGPKGVCMGCKQGGDHVPGTCHKFKEASVEERWHIRKEAFGCSNCLRTGHSYQACPTPIRCGRCGGRHHELMHGTRYQGRPSQ